jgi:hypothetical protein
MTSVFPTVRIPRVSEYSIIPVVLEFDPDAALGPFGGVP